MENNLVCEVEANAKGWTVVSMKDDWKTIFQATAQ